ncbi:LuxR C-terminal-related transcriptional regulator [Nostoc sp. NMS4]|uniref:helix-turn-helix transcriptional regulator n=1 Tax=Nostoc sp. NMS4 TaxID=2815390 RepID=UPI0025F5EB38|nr:LuxR C-terminal-related transcriptional regulator [Nostoc sp. NMS4]MBN3924016.1 response regulator transcription factor [Nostoc sp. NMS4]
MEIEISPAEARVIPLIGNGYSNKDIAAELMISVRTVETHLSNLYLSANVSSRTELLAFLKTNSFKVNKPNGVQLKIDTAHRLKNEGKTLGDIAQAMGIHQHTAKKYLKMQPKRQLLSSDFSKYLGFEVITSPPKSLCWFWGA